MEKLEHAPPHEQKGRWVVSRYADVMAALQHPQLWAIAGDRDEAGRLKLRADVLARFSQARMTEWRPQIDAEARRLLRSLPASSDLLRDFALPWGLTMAMLANGAAESDREMLGSLSTRVFRATGAADDSPERADAAVATAELERIFAHLPMGEPAFVALSQTMPRLLTNSLLALVQHPAEYARLRAFPSLISAATEEMLRFAGIVRRVFRRTMSPVEIGGVTIPAGQTVALMLAAANRDPAQFPDPDRLDFGRPAASHVSLGSGRNSCVGALPVRMALAVAAGALVAEFERVDLVEVGGWQVGSGFWFPTAVRVMLYPDSKHF